MSSYCESTACAASPSAPSGVESVTEPSAPVNTLVFAMTATPLLKRQGDADVVDAERRLHHDVHVAATRDLVLARRRHLERVGRERFVLHHRREEAVDRPLQ